MLKKIKIIFKEYTTGVPFVLWALGGTAIATFIFIFRNESNVNFGVLKYVLSVGAVWFGVTEVLKRREVFNPTVHFIIDGIFFTALFNLIIFYTGGIHGGLLFVVMLAMISAPFFRSINGAMIFVAFFSVSFIAQYFIISERVSPYNTGLVALQVLFNFLVVFTIRFLIKEQMAAKDAFLKSCEEEVKKQTEKLQKTIDDLNVKKNELDQKIDELERFKTVTIDRELKMVELKKELENKGGGK